MHLLKKRSNVLKEFSVPVFYSFSIFNLVDITFKRFVANLSSSCSYNSKLLVLVEKITLKFKIPILSKGNPLKLFSGPDNHCDCIFNLQGKSRIFKGFLL